MSPSALVQSARRQAFRYLPADPRLRRARASTVMAVATLATSVGVRVVTIPLALKILGVEYNGIWLALVSLLTWLIMADLGAPVALINPLVDALARDDRTLARRLVSSAFAFLVPLGVTVAVICSVVVSFAPVAKLIGAPPETQPEIRRALHAALALIAVAMTLRLSPAILRAQQRSYLANVPEIAGQILWLTALLAMWVIGGRPSLVAFVVAYFGSTVAAQGAMNVWVFFRHAPALRPSPSEVRLPLLRGITKQGLHFLAGTVGDLVLMQTDLLVISHFLGPARVLSYAVPYQMFYLAFGVVFSWAGPLWPAYTDAAARGEVAWIVRQHRRSLWQCVAAMAAASVAILLVGRPVIRLWVGPEAVPPPALLGVMAVYFPVWVWSWVNGNLLQALGGMNQRSRVMLLNAAINLGLSILLVRHYGMVGVSAGSLAAMLMTEAAVVPLLVRRRLRELSSRHDTARENGNGRAVPELGELPPPAT